jgi:hypothetical protein
VGQDSYGLLIALMVIVLQRFCSDSLQHIISTSLLDHFTILPCLLNRPLRVRPIPCAFFYSFLIPTVTSISHSLSNNNKNNDIMSDHPLSSVLFLLAYLMIQLKKSLISVLPLGSIFIGIMFNICIVWLSFMFSLLRYRAHNIAKPTNDTIKNRDKQRVNLLPLLLIDDTNMLCQLCSNLSNCSLT